MTPQRHGFQFVWLAPSEIPPKFQLNQMPSFGFPVIIRSWRMWHVFSQSFKWRCSGDSGPDLVLCPHNTHTHKKTTICSREIAKYALPFASAPSDRSCYSHLLPTLTHSHHNHHHHHQFCFAGGHRVGSSYLETSYFNFVFFRVLLLSPCRSHKFSFTTNTEYKPWGPCDRLRALSKFNIRA